MRQFITSVVPTLLATATWIAVALWLGRFMAEDTCYDLGGAIDRSRWFCEYGDGREEPLSVWRPNVVGNAFYTGLALAPAWAVFVLTSHVMRRLFRQAVV